MSKQRKNIIATVKRAGGLATLVAILLGGFQACQSENFPGFKLNFDSYCSQTNPFSFNNKVKCENPKQINK